MSSNTTDSSTSTVDKTKQLLRNIICSEYLASSCILIFVLFCFIAYEVRMNRARKFSFFNVSLSLLCIFGILISFNCFFHCSIPTVVDFQNPSLAMWHVVYYMLMYVRSSALIEKNWMKKAVFYYSTISVTIFTVQCMVYAFLDDDVIMMPSDPFLMNLMAAFGIASTIMMASLDFYYLYLFQSLKRRTEECLKFPMHLRILMQYGSYSSALLILEFIGLAMETVGTNVLPSIGCIIVFAVFTTVPIVLFFMRIRLDKENVKKSSINGATTTKEGKKIKTAAVSLQN